eukprot:scaffold266160_cov26-Tisochrysis_lutea.AAC.2
MSALAAACASATRRSHAPPSPAESAGPTACRRCASAPSTSISDAEIALAHSPTALDASMSLVPADAPVPCSLPRATSTISSTAVISFAASSTSAISTRPSEEAMCIARSASSEARTCPHREERRARISSDLTICAASPSSRKRNRRSACRLEASLSPSAPRKLPLDLSPSKRFRSMLAPKSSPAASVSAPTAPLLSIDAIPSRTACIITASILAHRAASSSVARSSACRLAMLGRKPSPQARLLAHKRGSQGPPANRWAARLDSWYSTTSARAASWAAASCAATAAFSS